MKQHIFRITSLVLLLSLIVIPATYSVYHDSEQSIGEWGTGSVEVELKAKKNHKNSHNFKHKDHNSENNPIAIEVKNIGTQAFYYAMIGELTSGNSSTCDQLKVTLWKDNKGDDPVYQGKLVDLVLQEVGNEVLNLDVQDKDLWWYQISFGKKSESCKGRLTAFAYQVEEKGGYEDQSSIALKKNSSNNNNHDWDDWWDDQYFGDIFEKTLHDDRKLKIKKYGPFLLVEFHPNKKMNKAIFAIRYTHNKGGEEVAEQMTGQVEQNALGEFIIPELYVGTCSTDEISCDPHVEVKDLTVSLLLKNDQQIVESVTQPVEWSEETP